MTRTAVSWRPGATVRDARYGWGVVADVTAIPSGLLVSADFGLGRRLLVVPAPVGRTARAA